MVGKWTYWGYRRSPVEGLVDVLGHGVDFGIKFFLNFDDILLIPLGDQIDGKANLPKSPRPSNSVQVNTALIGKIKVYDNIDGLNIDTSSYQIRAD